MILLQQLFATILNSAYCGGAACTVDGIQILTLIGTAKAAFDAGNSRDDIITQAGLLAKLNEKDEFNTNSFDVPVPNADPKLSKSTAKSTPEFWDDNSVGPMPLPPGNPLPP